jgi:hypothetical protein
MVDDTGTSRGRFDTLTWRKTLGLGAIVAVAVVLAGLLMWSLSGDPKSPTAGPGSGTAPGATKAAPSANPSSAVPSAVGPSRPTASPASPLPPGIRSEAASGFLTEMGAIDPALVSDRDRAIRAGQSTCQDIKAAKPHDALVSETKKRFGSTVDDVKASLIVDAAHNHLCP